MNEPHWFAAIHPMGRADPHAPYQPEDEHAPTPARRLHELVGEHLPRFILPPEFPLEAAMSELYIPPHVAFGAAPISLNDQRAPLRVRSPRSLNSFRQCLASGLPGRHIATAGDLLWLLPQMEDSLWDGLSLICLLSRAPAEPPFGPAPQNWLYLFKPTERRTENNELIWAVHDATTLLDEPIHDSPVTVIALAYRRATLAI